MNTEKIIEYLKAVDLFKNLENNLLEQIAGKMKFEKFGKKEIVFREGEQGNKMYILIDGKIVLSQNDCGKDIVISVMVPVNTVGVMAILDGEPRSLSLRSVSDDTKMLSLSKEDFKKIVLLHTEMAFEIMKTLSIHLRDANKRGK